MSWYAHIALFLSTWGFIAYAFITLHLMLSGDTPITRLREHTSPIVMTATLCALSLSLFTVVLRGATA